MSKLKVGQNCVTIFDIKRLSMEEDASNKKEDGFNKLSLYDLQVRLCLTFAARSDHL